MTFEGAGRCIYLSIYLVLVFDYFRQKCFWLALSIYLQYQTFHLSSHKNGHIICFCLICIKADIQNCLSHTYIGTSLSNHPWLYNLWLQKLSLFLYLTERVCPQDYTRTVVQWLYPHSSLYFELFENKSKLFIILTSLIILTMKHISIWTDVHLNFMHSEVVAFYPNLRHCPVKFEWSPLVMSTAQTIPPIVT